MSLKPRVLFILPLPPPVHGSSVMSRYIKDSEEKLDSFLGDYVNLSTSRKVCEIGKFSFKKIYRFIASYFKVLRLLFVRRYDVCYVALTCHGIGFLKDMPYVLLCKLFGCKVIIHQHNKGMSKDTARPVYRTLYPLVYRNTKVILLSWLLYPDVSAFVKRNQVLICPNGIPPRKEQAKNKRGGAIPRLLYLSNLIESKGIWVLLDSCRILKDRGMAFVCDMVGDASKEISFSCLSEEIKKRGLDDFVICHGPKYGKEKDTFFDNADIFVSPTYDDCFPIVLLEAMQHSLPVVSTYEGAIPDMISNGVNGVLCPRKKSEELADALACLLSCEAERIKMGEEGYKRYVELYTLSTYEKNIHRIIDNECTN